MVGEDQNYWEIRLWYTLRKWAYHTLCHVSNSQSAMRLLCWQSSQTCCANNMILGTPKTPRRWKSHWCVPFFTLDVSGIAHDWRKTAATKLGIALSSHRGEWALGAVELESTISPLQGKKETPRGCVRLPPLLTWPTPQSVGMLTDCFGCVDNG